MSNSSVKMRYTAVNIPMRTTPFRSRTKRFTVAFAIGNVLLPICQSTKRLVTSVGGPYTVTLHLQA